MEGEYEWLVRELCKHNKKLGKRELLENKSHKGREFVLKKSR